MAIGSSVANAVSSYISSLSLSSPRQSGLSPGSTQTARQDFVDTTGILGGTSPSTVQQDAAPRGGTTGVRVLRAPRTAPLVGSALRAVLGFGPSTAVAVALAPTMTAPPSLDELSPERLAEFQRYADQQAALAEAAGQRPVPALVLSPPSQKGLVVLPLDRPSWPSPPPQLRLDDLDLPPAVGDHDLPPLEPYSPGRVDLPSEDIGLDLVTRRELERTEFRGRQQDERRRPRWYDPAQERYRDPVRSPGDPALTPPVGSRRKPRDVPVKVPELQIDFSPHGPVRFRRLVRQRWMRPRKDSKYDQFYLWALQVIDATWGTLSEIDDALQAVMWSVYEVDPRTGDLVRSLAVRGSYLEVARAVGRGEAELNMPEAIIALAINEIQDQLVGRLTSAAQGQLNAAGWHSSRGFSVGGRMRS